MTQAIFIDRDGVLNEEVGYITELSQFKIYEYAYEAVRMINDVGWRAIVVTNQSGVARKHFSEEFLLRVHERMKARFIENGVRLDAVYYCPHHPEAGEAPYRRDCECRKPRTGMLLRAAAEFDLDLSRSFVIGDRYSDISLAHGAGAQGALVMTGYGREGYEKEGKSWPRQPDLIAGDLLEAVKRILK